MYLFMVYHNEDVDNDMLFKVTNERQVKGQPPAASGGRRRPKRPPRRPPSAGNEGPGPHAATEGGKDPPTEAVRGSAEEAEPRAEKALRVDPFPVSKETSEAGPERTIEGPATAGVAKGAQEGPPKVQLPRAPPSSDGDTGQVPCVAEEGAAEPAPEAEAGSADEAEPMQATSAEGPEGGKEPPQEQELPRAPEASVDSSVNAEPMQAAPAEGSEGSEEPPLLEKELPLAPVSGEEADSTPESGVGSADNAEPMQAATAEGPEGGEESPQPEQELPQASLSCGDGGSGPRAAAEGDEITPPRQTRALRSPRLLWSPEHGREGKNQRWQKVVPSR
ncbi:UNVERIFIED_CONTAM: hypothetical protein FKN15_059148 [Acipenser sinensis]